MTPSTNKCCEKCRVGDALFSAMIDAKNNPEHDCPCHSKPTEPSVCEHKNTFVSKSTRKGTRKICHECNAVLPKQPTPQQKEASWEEEVRVGAPWTQDGKKMLKRIRTVEVQAEKRGEVRALEWVLRVSFLRVEAEKLPGTAKTTVEELRATFKDRLTALREPHT